MSLNKRIGLGVTIGVDPAGGTSYTSLGSVVEGFKGPGAKAVMADLTLLADKFKTYCPADVDPGESTVTIAYDPDDASTTTLTSLLASTSPTPPAWQITYPAGSVGAGTHTADLFTAWVSGLGREIAKEKMITLEVTLKHTGRPGIYGD